MHGMFCVEAVLEDTTAETLPKHVRELPRVIQELNSTWSNHNLDPLPTAAYLQRP